MRVANLQHDGIVVTLPSTVPAEGVAAGMTAACSDVLGYEQPVCEKPLAVAAPAAVPHPQDAAAAVRIPVSRRGVQLLVLPVGIENYVARPVLTQRMVS